MTYTILQPTAFMEVWLSSALGFDFPNAKAQLFGTGENKLSWISYTDVARFAAASLDNPRSRNAVLKLGGPEALSPREVARIFEEVTGRKFDVQCVPEAALRKQKQEATDPFEQSFAALMLYCAHGDVIDMHETVRWFPGELRSVRDYARTVTAG
jgi:uncharacterized protein YbjT (DUF2867 family)